MSNMPNAYNEFQESVKNEEVICAQITRGLWSQEFQKLQIVTYRLSVGHSPKEYADFLSKLDFTYDTNCHECINGFVWLTEDSWIEITTDNDGYLYQSATWTKRTKPKIPKGLL